MQIRSLRMKLIVGLGNPGPDYAKTRHNAGFMALDRLWARRGDPSQPPKGRFSAITQELSLASERCVLIKPTTYMNLSGRPVSEALNFFKLDPAKDLLVLVDDVSLPTGTIRVRAGGGAGGHNGLKDIQRAISTQGYSRVRIGIDACPPMMKLEDYVLGRFTSEQMDLLTPALDKAIAAIEIFVQEGIDAAMNKINGPEPEARPSKPVQPKPASPTPPPSPTKPVASEPRPSPTHTPDSHSRMHPGWLDNPAPNSPPGTDRKGN